MFKYMIGTPTRHNFKHRCRNSALAPIKTVRLKLAGNPSLYITTCKYFAFKFILIFYFSSFLKYICLVEKEIHRDSVSKRSNVFRKITFSEERTSALALMLLIDYSIY